MWFFIPTMIVVAIGALAYLLFLIVEFTVVLLIALVKWGISKL